MCVFAQQCNSATRTSNTFSSFKRKCVRCHSAAQQCNSATVQQCSSATVQQCNSATVQQCNSATVQQRNSATVQQCNSATVQQCNSATVQQCNSAAVQQCNSATVHATAQQRNSTVLIEVRTHYPKTFLTSVNEPQSCQNYLATQGCSNVYSINCTPVPSTPVLFAGIAPWKEPIPALWSHKHPWRRRRPAQQGNRVRGHCKE